MTKLWPQRDVFASMFLAFSFITVQLLSMLCISLLTVFFLCYVAPNLRGDGLQNQGGGEPNRVVFKDRKYETA